jgi:hypothetical protein
MAELTEQEKIEKKEKFYNEQPDIPKPDNLTICCIFVQEMQ